ncbi:ATP-binding protein [Massilia sp. TSP1-1-2]|uniref:ATP-binding protein n=1 Tax=unclassified Massilia TaxID=2609279 RepID=UPI003CE6ED6A
MSARRALAANRRALDLALDQLAHFLALGLTPGGPPHLTYLAPPPALAHLCARLRLSRFEQDLLLLAAAPALDARFKQLLAAAHGDPGMPWLSFGLALRLLPNPDWGATTPVGALRRWQLLELSGPGSLFEAPLVVDEAILHQLAGRTYPDPRIAPWFRELAADPGAQGDGAASSAQLAAIGRVWQNAPDLAATPVLRMQEGDGERFVRALAAALGLRAYRFCALALPGTPAEREVLARLWEREALLRGGLLWIETVHVGAGEQELVADFIDRLQCLAVCTGSHALPLRRVQRQIVLPAASAPSRLASWQAALGTHALRLNGQLGPIAEQFHLSAAVIGALAGRLEEQLGGQAEAPDPHQLQQLVWNACRVEARHGLSALASRVDSGAGWDQLILPDAALSALRTIVAQVRQRSRVYREWGFGERGARGLGISALFSGGSGTGKTLAAEVLANELRLDLFRVDLAALVSKYIGETEKNLSKVFEAAEASGAILLFDEADALFGKRSEVKDSHDRYANLEVSYLLQRLETYRGLAILTTNLKQAIDSAFQRRIRFVVNFPFPDAAARSAIWGRVFPPATPTTALDIGKLARLSLSGGHIRNLALNAAFLAADAGDRVSMRHLRHAAEAEFAKLEKPLPISEVEDWT